MPRSKVSWLLLGILGGVALAFVIVGRWPQSQALATATHGDSSCTMATGYIDEEMEGLYVLDHLTGDLKATVLHSQSGKFQAVFSYNVAQDLAGPGSATGKYVMVTGRMPLRRVPGMAQPAHSVVYVANTGSGVVGAYVVPWNATLSATGQPQANTFILLHKLPFRTAAIRDTGER